MGLRMVLLLYAIIFVLWHIYHPSFSGFWHCHSYILQHFKMKTFLHTFLYSIHTGQTHKTTGTGSYKPEERPKDTQDLV